MYVVSLDQRLTVISGLFCQAYFGHVLTEKAIWAQLESQCDTYLAAWQNAALRSKSTQLDSSKGTQLVLKALADVVKCHNLNSFPVCPRHRHKVRIRPSRNYIGHSI